VPRLLSPLEKILSLALLVACAAMGCTASNPLRGEAQELYDRALDRWLVQDQRLQTVHQRLQRASLPYCKGREVPILGLVVQRASKLPEGLVRVGLQRFGREPSPMVTHVIEDSAAARAGVQRGDRILRISGKSSRALRSVYSPPPNPRPRVRVRVQRAGQILDLDLDNRPGCPSWVKLTDAAGYNAHAQRDRIQFFSGLLRYLRREEAVAFVLGHELAHNLAYAANGRQRVTIEDEIRADRAGAYLASLAGYELTADDFQLASVAVARPWNVRAKRTHPTGPERAVLFRQTIEEISIKRTLGTPLVAGDLER